MDSSKSARGDKRRTFLSAIGIVAAVMVLAPPIVQAATQKVNVVKSVSISVKNNGAIAPAQDHGALPGEDLAKRQMVDTFAGGEGFWGVGVCGAVTDPDEVDDTGSDDRVIVPAAADGEPDNVVGAILIGATVGAPAVVTVSAPTINPGGPIIALRTSAEEPTKLVGFDSGLRASPSRLVFSCPAPAVGTGASYVVVGH